GPRGADGVPARGRCDRVTARGRARGALALRLGGPLLPARGRGAGRAGGNGPLAPEPGAGTAPRTAGRQPGRTGAAGAERTGWGEGVRGARTADPAVLDRGKAQLMAQIQRENAPHSDGPTIVPQLPYHDIRAAVDFLERAFGFREDPSARVVGPNGEAGHAMM